MIINETSSINAQIKIGDVVVAHLSANVNSSNNTMSTSMNITNKDLINENIEEAQAQYVEWEAAVNALASALDCSLF